jgi:hypothetical protein
VANLRFLSTEIIKSRDHEAVVMKLRIGSLFALSATISKAWLVEAVPSIA